MLVSFFGGKIQYLTEKLSSSKLLICQVLLLEIAF
jgi:hypothetical protein